MRKGTWILSGIRQHHNHILMSHHAQQQQEQLAVEISLPAESTGAAASVSNVITSPYKNSRMPRTYTWKTSACWERCWSGGIGKNSHNVTKYKSSSCPCPCCYCCCTTSSSSTCYTCSSPGVPMLLHLPVPGVLLLLLCQLWCPHRHRHSCCTTSYACKP